MCLLSVRGFRSAFGIGREPEFQPSATNRSCTEKFTRLLVTRWVQLVCDLFRGDLWRSVVGWIRAICGIAVVAVGIRIRHSTKT